MKVQHLQHQNMRTETTEQADRQRAIALCRKRKM